MPQETVVARRGRCAPTADDRKRGRMRSRRARNRACEFRDQAFCVIEEREGRESAPRTAHSTAFSVISDFARAGWALERIGSLHEEASRSARRQAGRLERLRTSVRVDGGSAAGSGEAKRIGSGCPVARRSRMSGRTIEPRRGAGASVPSAPAVRSGRCPSSARRREVCRLRSSRRSRCISRDR